MKKTRNFKSMAGYKKWVAYGQMHGVFKKSKGNTPIKIKGRTHKVKHK